MKIAIVDEMNIRGESIRSCINAIFPGADLVLILGNNATGPIAVKHIHRFADEFDYIFVHHGQLDLAKQLSNAAKFILYSAYYDSDVEKQGEVWIREHVSEIEGATNNAILTAMGLSETVPAQAHDIDAPQITLFGAWHALASPHLSIEALEPHLKVISEHYGGDRDAKEFRKRYERNPKDAHEFAAEIKSAIKNRGPKSEQSLRFYEGQEYAKREFNILFVDDNKENYAILEKKLKQYLLDNNEPFEAKVVHIDRTENLPSQFRKLQNIQAVIFDDRFPSDIDIRETIANLKAIRPNVPFYISGSNILALEDETYKQHGPIVLSNVQAYEYKDEKRATALFDDILADLKERIETPYFTALNKYATERKSAFHALPITDGGSLNDSTWTREFTDFYKRKFFAAETSNTKSPLSSVFSPQGELQRALDKAATAFHSDKTLFITSGTTISNLLVYKIHIRKGDVVLLDWNCHKSHHNAMVECGARVKYLESEYNKKFGIAGLVSTKEIIRQLKVLKDANEPVKMISLTHPSFDGMLYDVEQLMREANKIFPGIIFFFDEAWFAYGVFHPNQEIRHRSAMLAATKIREEARNEVEYCSFPSNDVRVYVTHSIHKTLSSIRQGSMLHIHDPYLTFAGEKDRLHLEYMIDNAYETYITTSPNNSILASLDVARMQAQVEVHDRINRAIACVQDFKRDLQAMCNHSSKFKALGLRVIAPDELVPNTSDDNVLVDPLKVTLYFDLKPGAEAVKELNKYNVQINKYSANTVLLLFSIGVTKSTVNHLLLSLKSWAKQVVEKEPYSEDSRLDGSAVGIPDFHPDYLADSELQIACLKDIHDKLHASQIPDYTQAGSSLFQKATTVSISDCLNDATWRNSLEKHELVAAQAITPYPPGSPVIVAGQILSREILTSLINLKRTGGEIHGVVKNPAGEDCIIVSSQNNK